MAKAPFKKMQKVTLIGVWSKNDHKCSYKVSYQNAVVYSCGPKRMVLMNEDQSVCIGRNFMSQEMTAGIGENRYMQRIVDGWDRVDAAEEFATWWMNDHREGLEMRANWESADENYRKSMRKYLANLPEKAELVKR